MNFTKKETLALLFSCEFAKFFKSAFLQNTSRYLYLQNVTEMFISESEIEENLWNVMSGSYRNRDAK